MHANLIYMFVPPFFPLPTLEQRVRLLHDTHTHPIHAYALISSEYSAHIQSRKTWFYTLNCLHRTRRNTRVFSVSTSYAGRSWVQSLAESVFICLLLFYVLTTSKVISGWVPTCDNAHSLMANQATSTMTWYPTPLHCPDNEPTSPCPILIMSSTWLGLTSINLKVIGLTRPGFEPTRFEFPDFPKW